MRGLERHPERPDPEHRPKTKSIPLLQDACPSVDIRRARLEALMRLPETTRSRIGDALALCRE
jgi:hypothetical protein